MSLSKDEVALCQSLGQLFPSFSVLTINYMLIMALNPPRCNR